MTSRSCTAALFVLLFMMSSTAKTSAWADELDTKTAALKAIRETADAVCYTVQQDGKQTEASLSVAAQGALVDLFKKLADIKIQMSGELKTQEYRGILQENLAQALSKSSQCKQDVLNRLVALMLDSKAVRDASSCPPGMMQIVRGIIARNGKGGIITNAPICLIDTEITDNNGPGLQYTAPPK